MADPKRPADLLRGILAQARGGAGRAELDRALQRALGPELGAHCRVLGLRGGVLQVEIDSAPLYAELTGFRSEELREAMNRDLSTAKVAKIKFRMGGTGHV